MKPIIALVSSICVVAVTNLSVATPVQADGLHAQLNPSGDEIRIWRDIENVRLVTQVAKPDHRPYLHPIAGPDGDGVLTESRPDHHPHQTGLYWGFTRLNERDYFHHPDGDYWKRVSVTVLNADGDVVQWQTVYDLLDESRSPVLRESQIWSLTDYGDSYTLDLQWTGEAKTDVTIGEYQSGGLFLRMPWKQNIDGLVVNAARQSGLRAEGQRAVWMDVGMQVDGRDDHTHIAIFDHPQNTGFPQPWRVDSQMGVGPVRSRLGDWSIASGKTETIRHQLVIYAGELNDVELTKRWAQYSGQSYAHAQWLTAREEGRKAEFLTPEAAVRSMTLQKGFSANVYASEPMITQPMAFCWDDRGRMWVAENRDYESRQKGFANNGESRILILEDTDNDGVADSRKVFLEGIPFPAAIATGMGGLWLGAPPHLLYVPDADDDDKADYDDIEIRLTGWGIRDRHETLNSFRWGPDGWLYGCQGYATPSKVGKPAKDARLYHHKESFPKEIQFDGEATDINGGIWRYHPIKDVFEVVAHGFSNPWGLDFDAHGQQFITACVIPHLWHVIPGGIYHRQGGRHFNPHVYSDIRTIADHRHRSAHGGARIYQSDAFPPKYRGRIFMANIHEHAVLSDILMPKGSGYVGQHGDDFALANNAQWIGFSVEVGPKGDLYVLDWHDADICGTDVLNKETGRIFRYSPKQSLAQQFEHRETDLSTLSDNQLARLQLVDSDWHARRARTILQHRASLAQINTGTVTALKALLHAQAPPVLRLRALWTLHVIGELQPEELTRLLNDHEQWIRAWAIQLLCEDFSPPEAALKQFTRMAGLDPSPVVRLFLASAMQRIPDKSAWDIAERLAMHAQDNEDHNLPKMIWFGLEPLVPADPQRALALAQSSEIRLISRHVARRLVDADQLDAVAAAARLQTAPQLNILLGIRDGLEGRYDVEAAADWKDIYTSIRSQGGEHSKIALQLSQQFGDTVAAQTLLTTLQDRSASLNDRLDALNGLTGQKRPEVKPVLRQLLHDDDLRKHAIRSMAAFDDQSLTDALLKGYSSLNTAEKMEAVHTLASRPDSGWKLTMAIRDGSIPRRDIPAWTARLLQRVVGNGFLEVWGPMDQTDSNREAQFAKYRTLLTSDAVAASDASTGRQLFNRTCAACHKLHGNGGNIGPDITGANRTNLDYLLGNILTPSAVIQDAYRMHIVTTNDGRVWSGIPASENERQLRLRVANRNDPVVINKSDIESREIAPVSMMPEGLLAPMTDSEVLDLVKYLQTQRQIE